MLILTILPLLTLEWMRSWQDHNIAGMKERINVTASA